MLVPGALGLTLKSAVEIVERYQIQGAGIEF